MGYKVPSKQKSRANLIDNARRFKKEEWRRKAELKNRDKAKVQQQTQVIGEQQRKSIEWITEMKIVLVMLDKKTNVGRAEDL